MQTTTLRKRQCHLQVERLAKPPDPTEPMQEFYRKLPRLGSAAELLLAADALTQTALAERGILWLIDARPIDAGLSAIIVKLIQRGLIKGVAMSGAAAVRDFELAVNGITGEDVASGLRDGLLGMARETGEGMNAIINEGVKRGFGIGECLGRGILDRQPRYFTQSIMAACSARLVPCTVHISIGSDGFHCHPSAEGAMLGKGSLKDIQILGARMEELGGGGTIVSAGTRQTLREAFYSAFAAARNLGGPIENFSLIQFDESPSETENFEELNGLATSYHIPGPIELTVPLFTGALFSMVE